MSYETVLYPWNYERIRKFKELFYLKMAAKGEITGFFFNFTMSTQTLPRYVLKD